MSAFSLVQPCSGFSLLLVIFFHAFNSFHSITEHSSISTLFGCAAVMGETSYIIAQSPSSDAIHRELDAAKQPEQRER